MRKQKPMSFDDLLKELQGQKTNEEDPAFVPLKELFNPTFMSKHSGFNSFEEFLEKGNFQAETREEINNFHDELFNRHVARETDFTDWESMLAAAIQEHASSTN